MCSARKKFSPRSEVLSFTYPKLHTGKSWYIDFTSHDPATGTMRRKKYMLDSIPKLTDRRKRAQEMTESLLKLLRSGWSPWVNVDDNRGYTLLEEAFEKYERWLEKQPKIKTRQSYGSKLNILRSYIEKQVIPPKYVYQFNTSFVTDFLDWLYFDREVTGRTRNNYRLWCSSLATFFMEREYISTNPVLKIKNVVEAKKKRQPLTPEMLKALHDHLTGLRQEGVSAGVHDGILHDDTTYRACASQDIRHLDKGAERVCIRRVQQKQARREGRSQQRDNKADA